MTNQPPKTFLFIDVQDSAALQNQRNHRRIRSHAITEALARQRHAAEQQGKNFRRHAVAPRPRNHSDAGTPRGYLGHASVDPFATLSIDSRRLTTLMHLRSSIRACEPVFNVNDAIHYQSLRTVFDEGLTDGPLTAAIGLAMTYEANRWCFSRECSQLSMIAMRQLRDRLSQSDPACKPAVMGTVLLLLGIEYRAGARDQAQIHLDGLRRMLDVYATLKQTVPRPIQRAIYWQDLFSSIFVQTRRIVDHRTFHPGSESPRLLLAPFERLPRGFASRLDRLGSEYLCIVSEITALYDYRTKWLADNRDLEGLERRCNSQAELEGHLHELRQSTSDDLLIACCIAGFLCVFAFWNSIWNAALIPRVLSTQLLHHLRKWQRSELQPDAEILLWLVYIGKAFAIDVAVRDGFTKLQKSSHARTAGARLQDAEVLQTLHDFIWGDNLYHPSVGWFWQRIDESV